MQRNRTRQTSFFAVALCVILLGVIPNGAARAGWTDPVLMLSDAQAARGSERVIVQLTGSFHEQDLVQIPYPIQVLIRETQGNDQYVRYSLPTIAFSGSHAGLADGLDSTEVLELLTLGSPSDGELERLAGGTIRLALPRGFPAGSAEAQLFVVADNGGIVLSNALSFEIPPGVGE